MIGERTMKRNSLRAYLSSFSIFSLPHFSGAPGTNRRSTHTRLVMKSRLRMTARGSSLVLLFLGLTAAAQADDLIAGDVFLGNTGGKVVVFRPSTNSVVAGTPLSDGVTNPGPITSLFIDNTWHAVAADPGGSNHSNVVRFKILPPQTPLTPFDASCNGVASNIQSIAIDGKGNIFAANTNPPTLVE